MTSPASPDTTRSRIDGPLQGIRAARAQFPGGRGYLAACTLGLPTAGTVAALRADLDAWASGSASAAGYAALVERVRAVYARLVMVPVSRVAIGSQASVLAGLVAASVPDGAEVLCVDGDFSSMVFPFLNQAHRGVTVRHVPLADLAESITGNTWLVSWSLVQSATGTVAETTAIIAAARRHGTFTLCDTSQAAGWMPVDASVFDATICHAYKWLCAPRGVAFLTIAEGFGSVVRPAQAGWYAGEDVWGSCYGPGMRLAADARRFDVSPAWQAWVGAEPALEFFGTLDLAEVRRYDVGLADAFRAGLGIDPTEQTGQATVTWADAAGTDLARLTAAGLTASGRAGRARVAFHLWNDADDVQDALRALGR
ncbi:MULTISPECIES: aminotransferase class V-fold PLP-dependent enzyme [unclassified Cryobacterium]|uniref:aminotransferase class V-fold PLP-dependent enzyme n=1 Tax=unclassified Cryobacterium TaxID=2649013 RepID=UPI00106A665F|nr:MULTISPECIES: aminotransferase class V-fold PLP-dependent enzyme [unclassified Cryobacterium]TFB96350.1 aminotransferase class V-fold PLP-dependent enzyme [Cryobacterium sp. MDB2-A-1]TFC03390.1 aminotransferase class V-fold PLP-dependent enzyme [Cryobacterium sp. MDB2-33-2]TFC12634.1 aminotransferase class V-fold PLP-dependent enzyme [Cryobacterium sp. MDB2-A-2]TFC17028.1 aminotransferase class V-fold PLP-dependent enzyme [Cryobacterium sp. MDB2-10]